MDHESSLHSAVYWTGYEDMDGIYNNNNNNTDVPDAGKVQGPYSCVYGLGDTTQDCRISSWFSRVWCRVARFSLVQHTKIVKIHQIAT
jgi:hypothetical protein